MISEFSLFVFTTLGGLGAGLYAAAAAFPVKGKRANVAVPLIALVCLGIGGIALLLHLGRPERLFNAFANPATGITQEAIASMIFGAIIAIDLVIAFLKGSVPRALRIVGALVAVVFCFIMGMAYYAYESVAAWHALPTILLFLCGDLSIGILLLGCIDAEAAGKKPFVWTSITFAILAVLAFAIEGAHFAALGMDAIPFLGAVVLAAASAGAVWLSQRDGGERMFWVAFAAMFVAVVVARYAFYAVI